MQVLLLKIQVASLKPTGIFDDAYDDREEVGAEADLNNLETTMNVSSIPTTRIHKDHPIEQIIRDLHSAPLTRRMSQQNLKELGLVSYIKKQRRTNHKDYQNCLFACFLSQIEPKKVIQALTDPSWIEAMQEELLQFKLQKVWTLVDLPKGKRAIGTKWVYRNKKDERGIIVRNKGKRIEAIRLFLAYASFMGLIVYQMDVKSAFVIKQSLHSDYKALNKDEEARNVDVHFIVDHDWIIWFQVTPKVSHLHAVKRIFRYLKGQPKLGLWYPMDSPFDLEAFSDSDYAGASLDRKSTTGGCQFLGKRLISWQCKKQTIVANSTTEAEYVAAANCCGQVLWIQNQMLDYGFNFMNTKIHIDNESTICIVKNPVFHSKTKHIKIRHHFIRDSYEKKLIQVIKIHTDHNVADLLTKAFDVSRIGVDTASHIKYALTKNLTIYVSLIEQFWQTVTASTFEDEDMGITATIDGKVKVVSEASIRRHLKLEDSDGSTISVESHHTPTSASSTSQPLISSPSMPTTHVAEEAALMPHDSPLSHVDIIMEYLVNISKRRAFWSLNEYILKIYYSDYQYAVSIKEDTAYPCLHSPKTTKETSPICRIQRILIRRIEDIVNEARVFWGADEELSDGGSPRVIVYGYDGLPMQPVAPPSPDYVTGLEHPPSPDYVPSPEHPPLPAEVPYVPEPEYPEYLVPSDDETPGKDQPLPADALPVALSPGCMADSDPEKDPKEDPEEDHVDYPADGGDDDNKPSDDDDDDIDDEDEELFEDEDDDEEEEHLAPADSSAIPVVDPIPSAGDTEAFETDEDAPTHVPSPRRHTARISIRPEAPMPFPLEDEVERLLALPPSPLISLSPPAAEERLARCLAALALPSSPLPIVPRPYGSPNYVRAPPGFRAVMGRLRASSPSTHHQLHPSPLLPPLPSSLHLPPQVPTSLPLPSLPLPPLPSLLFIPPPVDRREDIPEAELPPHKRLCLTALTSRCEVGESLTAAPRPTGGHRADYGFIVLMRCRDHSSRNNMPPRRSSATARAVAAAARAAATAAATLMTIAAVE
ncbi:hypothetical protein Tco_0530445 [Tanacetum coccineum]